MRGRRRKQAPDEPIDTQELGGITWPLSHNSASRSNFASSFVHISFDVYTYNFYLLTRLARKTCINLTPVVLPPAPETGMKDLGRSVAVRRTGGLQRLPVDHRSQLGLGTSRVGTRWTRRCSTCSTSLKHRYDRSYCPPTF